jgi:hypothetical protein
MSLRTTEDKPTEWKIWVRANAIGYHFQNLPLSILPFAFIKAVQDDDDWFTRAPALEGGEWFNNELPELDWRRFP